MIDSRVDPAAAAAATTGEADGLHQPATQPNPYALAHLCNHGGGRGAAAAGSGSNVMAVAYNFPQDPLGWGGFPEELRPYIPNSYAKRRWVEETLWCGGGVAGGRVCHHCVLIDGDLGIHTATPQFDAATCRTLLGNPDQSALIQTVALVATTDLEDEELFLNYRLNPKHQEKLPPWYVPIDAEEDQRRWA